MASNGKKSLQTPCLPQLVRVIIKKLEVQRRDILPPQLNSEVHQEISLKVLKPKEKSSLVHIKGTVSVNGKWHNDGEKEPIVSFIGLYEARFIFPSDIQIELVEKWMEDPFYRDSAIAQAIPIVNLHMHSQLEMMGLSTQGKKIGYESKLDSGWKKAEKSPPVEPKRARKKIALIK